MTLFDFLLRALALFFLIHSSWNFFHVNKKELLNIYSVCTRSRLRSTCTSSTDSDECMQLQSEPSTCTVMSSSQ
ncbi:hypothetical protein BpHYR1_024031 [Brachionus plicatilis]|uniref:Secreted protein n=1 Tax=Brachionus plicatilis TaxID=10195 RepID=A0A3M7SIY8_BRAPC|nr:hypothetical protein BpHYR1_024031 [Brachionus plicatilis]